MSHSEAAAADLLGAIVAATERIVAVRRAREPLDTLAVRAEAHVTRAGVLRAAVSRSGCVNVIAECKRRSPSRGVLRAAYDPVVVARSYAAAGAAAISVLTEPTFFDGSLDHLAAVRSAVSTPLLRKDFVVDEYQLFEARAEGADGVLLIVAALTPGALKALGARAAALGLDALFEVHTQEELSIALDAGARIVGVNNRNLRTLDVDLGAAEALGARIPAEVVAVAESGIKTAEDIARLQAVGYDAFLIGERFMTEPDPGAGLERLLRESSSHGRARGSALRDKS